MKKFLAILFIASCKTQEKLPEHAYYWDVDDDKITLQKAKLIEIKDNKATLLTEDSFKMHLDRTKIVY